MHFENCQFEQSRADGLKKLKPNALSIIFVYRTTPNERKHTENRKRALKSKEVQLIVNE